MDYFLACGTEQWMPPVGPSTPRDEQSKSNGLETKVLVMGLAAGSPGRSTESCASTIEDSNTGRVQPATCTFTAMVPWVALCHGFGGRNLLAGPVPLNRHRESIINNIEV